MARVRDAGRMRYGSVCSGIEAATVAWHPLGWEAAFFSEIEQFPRAVLEHHYDVPVHGDFTTIGADEYGAIDLLAGGTPCQPFSVAGLRKGMGDERGNLALEFLRLAKRKRPTWLVWENVPGVLSSNKGRDFGAFLRGLAELGYGWAYRILDAQYFGVAQRRRRVFVVGYLGDWRPAAAVLFERHSLQGHPAPSRKAGEGTAHSVAPSLTASGRGVERTGETWGQDPVVAHTLRAEYDASEDGTGRGTPIVPCCPEISPALKSRDYKGPSSDGDGDGAPILPVAFGWQNSASQGDSVTPTLDKSKTPAVAHCVNLRGRDGGATAELSGPIATALRASSGGGDKPHVLSAMQVRRLTPRECERLQGFPDGYTAIPYRNKPADNCPDGPRYKALGNSMAVPVMRWIGERIDMVGAILDSVCPDCKGTGHVCCGGKAGYFECCQSAVQCGCKAVGE